MSDGGGKITIHVYCLPFWKSVAINFAGVGMLIGPLVVNELTLRSPVVSFLLASFGVVCFIGLACSWVENNRIRGDSAEEVITKLRQALKQRGAP